MTEYHKLDSLKQKNDRRDKCILLRFWRPETLNQVVGQDRFLLEPSEGEAIPHLSPTPGVPWLRDASLQSLHQASCGCPGCVSVSQISFSFNKNPRTSLGLGPTLDPG